MTFHCQAAQCEPLGPVPSEKSDNAAKAMGQIMRDQPAQSNLHNVDFEPVNITAPPIAPIPFAGTTPSALA